MRRNDFNIFHIALIHTLHNCPHMIYDMFEYVEDHIKEMSLSQMDVILRCISRYDISKIYTKEEILKLKDFVENEKFKREEG